MNRLWQETLQQLELSLPPQIYTTWIKPLGFVGLDKEVLVLEVPNRFFGEWIRDHYQSVIEQAISNLGAVQYQIHLQIGERTHNKNQAASTEAEPIKTSSKTTHHDVAPRAQNNINPIYTFDKFVSGSSNQFAFAAALAVANNPATTYNPLFIYGGVGLGKTHLLNAIGNAVLQVNGGLRVYYYTSEKFMNELINSIRYQKMDEFRNKFRSVDVLLIDDVQFIAGKERTQEEFFHTFNALYESHKQIVVTSDKFPREIPGLEERIRSRFEWGLIADIQPPDIETKLAILRVKANQNGISIPEDVAFFLANSVSSNIRELEGYLVRIVAYANLMSLPVTLATAREVLRDILVEKGREISIEEIQKAVAAHFNIKVSDLRSAKRLKNLVLPRQMAMYLSRQLTSSSFPDIGEKFGGKDHSTIIYAMKKMDRQLEEDLQLKAAYNTIKTGLNR